MLGMPMEERKKAYAGKTMQDLVQDYQKAERRRDLPTMIALLDIIKTAPKPVAGPPTTVVQDAMAAVMPQPARPAMATPGIEGAVDAMAAQNAPQQLDMPAVMAADGGFMNNGDDEPADGFAKGGPARFFLGGQGTVAPYSSFSALPIEDVERMAMMGDPDAQRELSNRMRSNVRPPSASGPGVGPATPQVTDRFRVGTPSPTPTTTAPAGVSSVMGPPRPGGASLGINRLLNTPGVRFFSRHPYATALTATTALATPLIDRLMATDRGTPSEELDPISAMQGTQSGIDRTVPGQATFVNPPAQSPGAPAASTTPNVNNLVAPSAPSAPALGFNIPAARTARDYLADQAAFEKDLREKEGIRSLADIRKDIEEMGKKGAERAAADKAAAQAAFKDEALLAAALAAPQFLKGRGLGQATARFAETATPGLMGAMQARKASIKEANKMARDSEDKYKLAGLEMERAERAERKGDYKEATNREDRSLQLFIEGTLKKYAADMQFNTYMQYADKAAVTEGIKTIGKELELLSLKPEFKNLTLDQQQAYIRTMVRDRMDALRSAVGGTPPASRPKITNVPG